MLISHLGRDWTRAVIYWAEMEEDKSWLPFFWIFVIFEWTDRINKTLKGSLGQSDEESDPRVAQPAALCGATCGFSGTLKWNRAVIDVVSDTWACAVVEECVRLFTSWSVQDFAVSTVPVCGGARLKNICSMGGPDTIIISNSSGAKKTLRVSVCWTIFALLPSVGLMQLSQTIPLTLFFLWSVSADASPTLNLHTVNNQR